MAADRWDEQVGSVADEATRLLESLRRTAEASGRSADEEADDGADEAADPPGPATRSPRAGMPSARVRDADGGHGGAGGDAPPHDPTCTWCPLCRGVAVIRSLSPETLTRLADLAGLAATVLTDLASTRQPADPAASGTDRAQSPGHGAAGGAASRPRRSHPAPSAPIQVRDADDPQEAPRG